VRAVRAPMRHPHRTASGVITESPLVLTDVITDAGLEGHSVIFTYGAAALKPAADLIRNLEPLVTGEALAPLAIEQKLAARFRLLGVQGLVGMAIAAIDMAVWDALARAHATSLVRLLGGVERPLPAYGAVGYDGAAGAAKTAEDLAKQGFTGVKAKTAIPPCRRTSRSSAPSAPPSAARRPSWSTTTSV
jgi:mandelate racemase